MVGLLAGNVTLALSDGRNVDLPKDLTSQVDLDNTNFVSNDHLKEVLATTTATPEQVDAAVSLNEQARLSALKTGLLILAALSGVAIIPAGRLPGYTPEEIPDPDPIKKQV